MTTYDKNQVLTVNFHNPGMSINDHSLYRYPIGNTRNRSITEQIGTAKEQHLDLLFLACGDLRNILCTISELSQRTAKQCPKSVDIHLNDYDPSILSRNAIILEVVSQINPDVPEDIDFLWNVWYNMALSESHGKRLRNVIASLLDKALDGMDGSLLRIQDPGTKQHCTSVWKDWLGLNLDVESTKRERTEFNRKECKDAEHIAQHIDEEVGLSICPKLSEFQKSTMGFMHQEIDHWAKEGSTSNDIDFINPTLISAIDHSWKMSPESCAFMGYMPFDAGELMRHKSLTTLCKERLKVWVQKFQQFCKVNTLKVSLWAGEALYLCTSGLPREMFFDVIDTSNVSDYVGLLNVLVCCGPRLKRPGESQLQTSSMLLWCGKCTSVQEYYNNCIGIDTNLLPTVLGLHLAVDFDLGNRRIPDDGLTAEGSLHWVKAETTRRSILSINKESDILTALWSLTKRCFNLVDVFSTDDAEYGATCSSPLTLLRICHQMSPVIQGGACRIFGLLERELPYDFYQRHGFTWKLLKSIATHDGEPLYEIEVPLKLKVTEEGNKIEPIPMIVFLKELHEIFFGDLDDCPVLYQTARFSIKENTVKFHMLERDWNTAKSQFLLSVAEHLDRPAFVCEPINLRDCDAIQVHRIDPETTFGLFANKDFKVEEEPHSLLQITKIEEEECSYTAELVILDPSIKKMTVDFSPYSRPVEVNIKFAGILGANMKFSCPIIPKHSSFRVFKKRQKVICKIRKAQNMVSGEMALHNPAQVPFHVMSKWDKEVDDIEWICKVMFRRKCDVETLLQGERGEPIHFLRGVIGEIFRHQIKENSTVQNLYHIGLTENREDDTAGLYVKVNSLIYKWNHLPFVKCCFCEHPQNKGVSYEEHFLVGIRVCTDSARYIYAAQEELELFRQMMCINAARTEQVITGPTTAVWKNSFICPLYPREGVLNKPPETIFEVVLRRKMAIELIGRQDVQDGAQEDEDSVNSSAATDESKVLDCCTFCQKLSKELKKCMGCKKVSYCNKNCQRKHWESEHKNLCSKPAGLEDSVSTGRGFLDADFDNSLLLSSNDKPSETVWCAFCRKRSKSLKKCTRCKKVSYCDGNCQAKHWENGHKDVCVAEITEDVASKQHSPDYSEQEDVETQKHNQSDCCDVCENPLEVILKRCTGCKKLFCTTYRKKTSDQVPNDQDSCMNQLQATNTELDMSDLRCKFCKKSSKTLKKCTGCEKVSYCTKDCQRRHWEQHKLVCRKKK